MLLYQRKAHILLVFVSLYPIYSNAVDFSQCFADMIACANSSGQGCVSPTNIPLSNITALSILRMSNGSVPDSPDAATGLSYHGCVLYCGAGQEPFNWSVFSQEYCSWLLPYLALLSQLPFGARRRTDNLMSAILTLGSPTLAGYSIYITLLNARWLNDRLFSGIDYPSAAVRQSVVRVLSSLQQVPLRVHPGDSARFESLVVHPDNDVWWTTLAKELHYSDTWSIASATSISWVVVAYLLTVADSFSNVSDNINSNGEGTGSVWLWLLPIVVGWLVLSPKCDYTRVHDAYDKANEQAFVAGSGEATPVTSNYGLTIHSSPDWEVDEENINITSPDESRIPPIFNYSRTLSWSRTVYVTSLYYRAAWRKSNRRVGVSGGEIPGRDVPRESRVGDRDQIIGYCHPDDHEHPGPDVLWPRGVFLNMFLASLMSLALQWGTTGAAVVTVWFIPTVGLGCRSLAYLIYGALSTTVWFLLLSSSVLGYYAHRLIDDVSCLDLESNGKRNGSGLSKEVNGAALPMVEIKPPNIDGEKEDVLLEASSEGPSTISEIRCYHSRRMYARNLTRVADLLRWIGKSVAIVNAVGIIANSVFQYASVYDNCYCDSSLYSWGSSAFNVINPTLDDIHLAGSAWIGSLTLSLASCAFFVGTIYLVRDSILS